MVTKHFIPFHSRPFDIKIYDKIIKKLFDAHQKALEEERRIERGAEVTKAEITSSERRENRYAFEELLREMQDEIKRSLPELKELYEMEIERGLEKFYFSSVQEQALLESQASNIGQVLSQAGEKAIAERFLEAVKKEERHVLYWVDRYSGKSDLIESLKQPWKEKVAKQHNSVLERIGVRLTQFANLPQILSLMYIDIPRTTTYVERVGEQPPFGTTEGEQLFSILVKV